MNEKIYNPVPDDLFVRGDVPMTKEEIRTLAISKLRLNKKSILVDIGAGTGSISIEGALIAEEGKIYAIERNTEAVGLIEKNISKFKLTNITVIKGRAPEMLNGIKDFDCIFIGGSGGNLKDILEWIDDRIKAKGRIVINSITIDTLSKSSDFFKEKNYKTEIIQVSIAKCENLKKTAMLKALNPIFIITAVKE